MSPRRVSTGLKFLLIRISAKQTTTAKKKAPTKNRKVNLWGVYTLDLEWLQGPSLSHCLVDTWPYSSFSGDFSGPRDSSIRIPWWKQMKSRGHLRHTSKSRLEKQALSTGMHVRGHPHKGVTHTKVLPRATAIQPYSAETVPIILESWTSFTGNMIFPPHSASLVGLLINVWTLVWKERKRLSVTAYSSNSSPQEARAAVRYHNHCWAWRYRRAISVSGRWRLGNQVFKVILGFEEFEASLPGLVDMGTCPFPKK